VDQVDGTPKERTNRMVSMVFYRMTYDLDEL